ncbi:Transcriptional activator HAC1 [Tolypocladium paradoxum]|uniref:Transcriptional activator HAC1 n=1 Tax=Tolypocladium paradoxum TaxID=94208 RepID=A0A2S4L1R4_9HYPO|nr:Transcriptional activator HAC1 [Tolypocladium paradoxum]
MMLQQASPMVKFEASPVESFVSTPGDSYSSLFPATSPSASDTMNPMEMLTPQSSTDDKQSSRLSVVPEGPDADDEDAPTSSDKKQTKKRKSWGQVLPEPKTNLPPRKRAKTEDEKEQRRVERVLRNRRAAQSSRERKRLEVEALEQRNKELESLLINAQKANLMLVDELNRFRRDSGVVTRSSSPLDPIRDNQVTLSQQLFGSQDGHNATGEHSNLVDDLMMSTTNPTVNPASLSPELGPLPDEAKTTSTETQPSEQTLATSPVLTQHVVRPAVSHVGGGAQVVSGFADSHVSLGMDAAAQDAAAFGLGDAFGLSAALDSDRYVLESGLLASPNSSTLDDDYLASDSAASFSDQSAFDLFNIDDFLNDEANHVASDIMAASDYAAADLGFEPQVQDSEIHILSSSPNLARPLMDATMVAMRLVSEGCDDRVENLRSESDGTRDEVRQLTRCLRDMALPSQEVLLTLLWALKVEERRIQRRSEALVEPESGTPADEPTKTYILKLSGMKRSRRRVGGTSAPKRLRLT